MLEEKKLTEATLCFLVTQSHILLGVKTKKIGAGCRNGYGGGPENGETLEKCVAREVWEEAGVIVMPSSLKKVAVVDFHNTKSDGSAFVCKVHVYFAHQWEGEARATEEVADPQWFLKTELPLVEMMPADRHWLSEVVAGKKVIAKACYGPFQKELWGPVEVQVVDLLP